MKTNTIESIGLKWGAITFVLLSIYFSVMKAFGLVHMIELRILNAGIMFFGVYMATKEAKVKLEQFTYLKGIGLGLFTAAVASSMFAAFGLIYLTVINPAFIESIRANELFGRYINVFGATLQIFIEGTFSGCLISYAVMQRLKVGRLDFKEKLINHQD
ncbi:DUF4199 domain-containing protein [Fulvivirga sp. RKSG066]|uniref:DUF4199 domain-containing protein n=1 Tax=Fulvivirga aurantia TaxID=2529383 RepID=UPI0012BB4CB3|nr:DUF4199 domain-containing protein [Fulvivirga aurantia]MTI21324.1 DUF4199 domain-containing protein [Fulvivirga aurantia]